MPVCEPNPPMPLDIPPIPLLPIPIPPIPEPMELPKLPNELPRPEEDMPEPNVWLPKVPELVVMPLICPQAARGSLARAASRMAETARVHRMIGSPQRLSRSNNFRSGKRGQAPFAGTALRVLRTKGACPLFPLQQ